MFILNSSFFLCRYLQLNCLVADLLVTVLNVGETCKGDNKDLCVSGATCDKNSKRCTCKDGFRELDDVCGR